MTAFVESKQVRRGGPEITLHIGLPPGNTGWRARLDASLVAPDYAERAQTKFLLQGLAADLRGYSLPRLNYPISSTIG